MREPFQIAGDGVAGLTLGRRLVDAGAEVVVHGDGRARAPVHTLVHRYAGRSFRTDEVDDAAWAVATRWLDQLVEGGHATRTRMARPLSSPAGARLERSLDHAEGVTRERVAPFGDAFVYGPAYVIDVASALTGLADGLEVRDGRWEDDGILAVGAALEHSGVQAFGGHLVTFDGELDIAVSGGGVHAVPTADGVCVGSTWWPPDSPIDDDAAVADLRERAEQLGVELGQARDVWRGLRSVYQPDRRPLVGHLDDSFIVGALGTRGWFWAPYLAELAAGALLQGAPIARKLDVARHRLHNQ